MCRFPHLLMSKLSKLYHVNCYPGTRLRKWSHPANETFHSHSSSLGGTAPHRRHHQATSPSQTRATDLRSTAQCTQLHQCGSKCRIHVICLTPNLPPNIVSNKLRKHRHRHAPTGHDRWLDCYATCPRTLAPLAISAFRNQIAHPTSIHRCRLLRCQKASLVFNDYIWA